MHIVHIVGFSCNCHISLLEAMLCEHSTFLCTVIIHPVLHTAVVLHALSSAVHFENIVFEKNYIYFHCVKQFGSTPGRMWPDLGPNYRQ